MTRKHVDTPRDILKRPYARILIPEEDGSYSAQMLEFPGCYGQGDTAEEAVGDLEKAAEAWLDVAIEQQREIPEPLAAYGFSGKINLRLPRSLHRQAASFAQQDDVSLNQFFTSAIAARVGAEDLYNRLVERLEGRITATTYTIQIQQVMGAGMSFPAFMEPMQFPGVSVTNVAPVITVANEQKVIADG